MIETLAFATTVVCVAGGLAVLGTGLAGRYRRRRTLPALAVVQLALIVQVVADVAGLLGGDRPAEPGTHLAYVATSLLLLPAATAWSAPENGRWGAMVLAVALLAVAVVVVRAQTTWRPA